MSEPSPELTPVVTSAPILPPPPEPAPERASFPAEPGTAIVATPGHFAVWAEKHLVPHLETIRADVLDARIKAENAITAARRAAPVLEEVTAVLGELVKASGPSGAPAVAALAPRIEAVIAEAARIAEALAATGM